MQIPRFLGMEIEILGPPNTISYKDILQLRKVGMDDPSGGLPPPQHHRSRKTSLIFRLKNFNVSAHFGLKKLSVWLRLGSFLSKRRPVYSDMQVS